MPQQQIRKRFTLLWLFPILTVIAAAYLIYDTYKDKGPLITINFSEAPDIEAGKSVLRYRGITVGTVEEVEFAESLDKVQIKARLTKAAENLAREGAKFTLVQPQISFQGVHGLDAIMGGSYILVEPGHGRRRTSFHGQLIGQDATGNMETVSYRLRSKELFSISKGDPVTYRGLTVGSIGSVTLSKDGRWVELGANIQKRYRHLVGNNSVFWRASGIQANLGLFSSKVDISSVEALMKGAVGFATPNNGGGPARPGKIFDLQPKAPNEWQNWAPNLIAH
jgi:paraquat-inducible protein B